MELWQIVVLYVLIAFELIGIFVAAAKASKGPHAEQVTPGVSALQAVAGTLLLVFYLTLL
jgi:hypothetical protein